MDFLREIPVLQMLNILTDLHSLAITHIIISIENSNKTSNRED